MIKIIKMPLIFIILFSSASFAYDPVKLDKDLNLIKEKFLPIDHSNITSTLIPSKKVRSREISKAEEIKDLESLYFDEIKTKAAAPIRKNKRSRSR